MKPNWNGLLCTVAFAVLAPAAQGADMSIAYGKLPDILVIAHRGASASRPEHTIAAYTKAIDDGADVIEPDLVSTRDGVLVARHENEISGTTDVAQRPEFASRRTTRQIDGKSVTGWFTEDFTLAELKTLRARERIPRNRPANLAYDGQFEIPTLQEIIELAQRQSVIKGRTIGLYPETKHPGYFQSIGLPMEQRLVEQLHAGGYRGRDAPVFIQSFEVANLKVLRKMTDLRLVQLIAASGQPDDFRIAGDSRDYRHLASPAGLREVAGYADAIGPAKEMVVGRDGKGALAQPTSLVSDAHAAGLLVHPWTFRPENPFLPANLRAGDLTSASQRGDLPSEITAYLRAGVDGIFTDEPADGRSAVDGQRRK